MVFPFFFHVYSGLKFELYMNKYDSHPFLGPATCVSATLERLSCKYNLLCHLVVAAENTYFTPVSRYLCWLYSFYKDTSSLFEQNACDSSHRSL